MIFFKRNWIGIIVFSMLFMFLYFALIKYNERINNLNSEKVMFTTGVITSLEQGKGGPWFHYKFVFISKPYSSRTIIGELSKEKKQKLKTYIGKKYFVKFSTKKPQYSEIYLDKPIPEDYAYKEGQTWSKIPVDYE